MFIDECIVYVIEYGPILILAFFALVYLEPVISTSK